MTPDQLPARIREKVSRLRRIERAEVADLKFDAERLEKAVDVLAASVNAATIRAEKAEAEVAALRAERDRWRRIAMDQAERPATYASADVARDRPAPMKAWGIDPGEVE